MPHRWIFLLVLSLIGGLLIGCGPQPQGDSEADKQAEASEFVTPPIIETVTTGPDGSTSITGIASANERVRLIQENGTAFGATSDDRGRFHLSLNPSSEARLLAISVQRDREGVNSDGWLLIPSDTVERSVLLRPGGPSLPIGRSPILAVADVDNGGGVAVAGQGPVSSDVFINVDGARRGQTRTNAQGRWAMALEEPISPGAHMWRVTIGNQVVERRLQLEAVTPSSAIDVERHGDRIRVAWGLPGGGFQTTYILLVSH